jgi:hypothetical protein
MPDRPNKWDECHRIYPKIGEILDWANEIYEERTWSGATHFLTATAIASSGDPLAPRGLIRSLIHGEGLLARAIRHVEEIRGPAVLSQIPSALAELGK